MNSLVLRNHLINLVAYEKWANEQWLDFVDGATSQPNGGQLAARAAQCIGHIVGCYRHWFDLLSEVKTEALGDHRQDMAIQADRMKDFLTTCDFDKPLRRSWVEYGIYQWSTLHVIYHAISHGSYHRGQIRAIAEELGFEEWPDTDFEAFSGVKVL